MKTGSKAVALVLVLAVALVVAAGATAAPKLTVKGDARAWAEIDAALTKLFKLKTYRMKITQSDQGSPTTEVWDVVNPDRMRATVTVDGKPSEVIFAGGQMYSREAGGSWVCVGQMTAPNATKLEEMTGEVTAARGPAATVDGVQTQSYTYSWKSEYGTAHFKVFVGVGNGLPKRQQWLDDKGAVQRTWDFFDYSAPITIALPACR